MIVHEISPTILTWCFLVLSFFAFITAFFGRMLPGKGIWIVWGGLFFILMSLGFDSGIFLKQEFKVKFWSVGWVWSRDEVGAITVGVFQDYLSLLLEALVPLMALLLLLMEGLSLSRDPRSEKAYTALMMGVVGCGLTWNAATPWLALVGLSTTLFASFLSLGSRWESSSEAVISIRFLSERAVGLLLSFLGACLIAASRPALLLGQAQSWGIQTENYFSTWVGAILLVCGLFIQLLPFPLLSWKISNSEINPALRTFLNQVIPAFSSLALLIRLEPEFRQLGLFPIFGYISGCSALFAVISGLFQETWRLGFGAWVSAGFSLSMTYLCFSGPISSLAMLIGFSSCAMCLSGVATQFEILSSGEENQRAKLNSLRVLVVLATLGGTGMIGFLTGTASLRWFASSLHSMTTAPLFLGVFFVFIVLGWKLAWKSFAMLVRCDLNWIKMLSLYFWIALSLGIGWTGSITGQAFMGISDQVMMSLLDRVFGAMSPEISDLESIVSISSLYWGVVLLAFMLGYWIFARKKDPIAKVSQFAPSSYQFVASGYQMERFYYHIGRVLQWSGEAIESVVDHRIWSRVLPHFFYSWTNWISYQVAGLDMRISSLLEEFLRRLIEVPAKILQLIQAGDLRWYVVFALGSGFAIMLHFLKIKGT